MTGLFDLWELDSPPGHALLEATCAMGFSEPVARAGLKRRLKQCGVQEYQSLNHQLLLAVH